MEENKNRIGQIDLYIGDMMEFSQSLNYAGSSILVLISSLHCKSLIIAYMNKII